MLKPELYNKTVDILVAAYFADTLAHGSCAACAVGNIVSSNMGYEMKVNPNGSMIEKFNWVKNGNELPYPGMVANESGVFNKVGGWGAVFTTNNPNVQKMGKPKMNRFIGAAKEQIESTGYTVDELAKIEFHFETAKRGKSDEEWMFNGLMNVINALDIIHQNNDTQVTQYSKSKFIKQPA